MFVAKVQQQYLNDVLFAFTTPIAADSPASFFFSLVDAGSYSLPIC
jgi:hypothetical protein